MSASTGTAEAVERMFPPHPYAAPPLCGDCGHDPTAHGLIGAGTCAGTADSGVLDDGTVWARLCPCVRFRFPVRQPA